MGVLTNINLKKGDAVFFNDELILHGRNAFIGDRWLKKGGLTWSG
jgi:alpha-ketoglutarate-dependent taurine dioxygenase